MDIDCWFDLMILLVVICLSIQNVRLRKYKKLWNAHAENMVQSQIDFCQKMQYRKPKIKDIN